MALQLPGTHIESIAQVIQLSVAPVFMLTGVASTLSVLVGRLVRIVDRARVTETQLKEGKEDATELRARLQVLAKRAHLISRAIALSVVSALLVPLVIVSLFVSALMKWDLSLPIASAFIVALLALAVALIYFLREIFVATAALSFSIESDGHVQLERLQDVLRKS
jgi:hypothetical protein